MRLKWARGLVMKPAALAAQNVGGALESLVGLGFNSFVSTYSASGLADVIIVAPMSAFEGLEDRVILLNHFARERNQPSWNGQAQCLGGLEIDHQLKFHRLKDRRNVTSWRRRVSLQPGLDGFEQPEAHRAVVACERDHEAHSPMLGGVGIARQGADAGKGAGLEAGAVAAP